YAKFDKGLRGAMYEALHVKPADRQKAFKKIEPIVDQYKKLYNAWTNHGDNSARVVATDKLARTLDDLDRFLTRAID
ncbi:MAG TPA: hypothetical protein VGJ13_11940, partial [Pseudonocardiaceae bacterium]